MTRHYYMPWPIQAALARERYLQPVVRDGITFIPTGQTAQAVGVKRNRLSVMAREYPACNVVSHTEQGIRFIRIPRDRSDRRPLLYWDVESVRKLYGQQKEVTA